jgi:hypothetical protein
MRRRTFIAGLGERGRGCMLPVEPRKPFAGAVGIIVPRPQLALSVVLAAHPRRDQPGNRAPGKLTGEARAKAAREATMDLIDILLIAVGGPLWLWFDLARRDRPLSAAPVGRHVAWLSPGVRTRIRRGRRASDPGHRRPWKPLTRRLETRRRRRGAQTAACCSASWSRCRRRAPMQFRP